MKAKDFRLGNYVLGLDDKTKRVMQVSELISFSNGEYSIDADGIFNVLEPIPLTEEWLLKFGFNPFKDVSHEKKIGTVILDIYKDLSWSVGLPYEANGSDIKIQYVHQLQNLYFALTGEELTIE